MLRDCSMYSHDLEIALVLSKGRHIVHLDLAEL